MTMSKESTRTCVEAKDLISIKVADWNILAMRLEPVAGQMKRIRSPQVRAGDMV
jgi:hypothetical protein